VISGVLGFWRWPLLMVSGPGHGEAGLPAISGVFLKLLDFIRILRFSLFLIPGYETPYALGTFG
jgi:hypothetical protein